jgi:hypothetical protein
MSAESYGFLIDKQESLALQTVLSRLGKFLIFLVTISITLNTTDFWDLNMDLCIDLIHYLNFKLDTLNSSIQFAIYPLWNYYQKNKDGY